MKLKYIYLLVSVISVAFLTLTAFTGKQSLDDEIVTNKDLINFSHSFHSDLAECADCHSAVSESISLNDRLLPDHEDCSNCHEVDDEEDNIYIFWNGDDCYIDTSMTKKIRYINHDCDFNCDVVENGRGGLMLIAYHTIEAGEELTIDYGYDDIYENCECKSCLVEEEDV